MRSIVDICNLGLGHLGLQTINATTESSNRARRCNQFYDFALDAALRANDWSCATKTQYLALISRASVPEWDYIYAKPSNCLFIRKVYNEGSVDNAKTDEFEEFDYNGQNAIGCDIEDAYCKYTRRISDPNAYDPTFVIAFSYKLAEMLAKPLTGDDKLTKSMGEMFKNTISDAGRQNAQSRNVRPKKYSSFIDAR